jgi:hypothetical protein
MPVLFQFFLMELSPSEDEAELSAAEVAVDDLEIVDAHLRFSFGMTGMEMREAMVSKNIAIMIPKKRLIVGMSASWRERRRCSVSRFQFGFRSLIRSLAPSWSPDLACPSIWAEVSSGQRRSGSADFTSFRSSTFPPAIGEPTHLKRKNWRRSARHLRY